METPELRQRRHSFLLEIADSGATYIFLFPVFFLYIECSNETLSISLVFSFVHFNSIITKIYLLI